MNNLFEAILFMTLSVRVFEAGDETENSILYSRFDLISYSVEGTMIFKFSSSRDSW